MQTHKTGRQGMQRILIRCADAHWLMSRGRDAPLPWLDRARLYFHLRVCQACRRVSASLDLLGRAVKRLGLG